MSKIWKFRITEPVQLKIRIKGRSFQNEWIKLTVKGLLTIKASKQRPFAWDGCTPKWIWFDLMFGTPDGAIDQRTGLPKTYYNSLAHDALYQFIPRDMVSRKEADEVMRAVIHFRTEIAWTAGMTYRWSGLYYRAVRLLGGKWWNKKQRS